MRQYEPRIERFLAEIATTPTGWPLVDWVRLHWPKISYGRPLTGGAFAFPYPFARVVIKDAWSEEWQRETLAHELVHMVRWRGHLVDSLEQEYDAYFTAAKVRCEWNGWDWSEPHEQAVKHYPLFFGPKANKDEFKRTLPQRLDFYAVLPWHQPYQLHLIIKELLKQAAFGGQMVSKEAQQQVLRGVKKIRGQA